MRIVVTSVFVEDQEKALSFYTEVLGFQKKTDIPLGEDRWLTVVSPEEPDGVELLLEPSGHPAVKPFKQALVEDGMPVSPSSPDGTTSSS
jgi:catechol 2,3-dioxygenase-like lactoylglutathione lyase family enzyme